VGQYARDGTLTTEPLLGQTGSDFLPVNGVDSSFRADMHDRTAGLITFLVLQQAVKDRLAEPSRRLARRLKGGC
jgi:hypothetical protein